VKALPGIPTIRPFEALACGIPLVCSPWEDTEGLFATGKDFLLARNGEQMTEHLEMLLRNPEGAQRMARHGLDTIRGRHTCAHRVNELLEIHLNEQRGMEETACV
jgi:spore maturation protein CgeB